MISVHNPSTVKQELLRFTVPANLSYKAYKINSDSAWEEVPSDLLCYTATKDNRQADQYAACELFIKSEVKAHDLAYIKVEVTSADNAQAVPIVDSDTIENENINL